MSSGPLSPVEVRGCQARHDPDGDLHEDKKKRITLEHTPPSGLIKSRDSVTQGDLGRYVDLSTISP